MFPKFKIFGFEKFFLILLLIILASLEIYHSIGRSSGRSVILSVRFGSGFGLSWLGPIRSGAFRLVCCGSVSLSVLAGQNQTIPTDRPIGPNRSKPNQTGPTE